MYSTQNMFIVMETYTDIMLLSLKLERSDNDSRFSVSIFQFLSFILIFYIYRSLAFIFRLFLSCILYEQIEIFFIYVGFIATIVNWWWKKGKDQIKYSAITQCIWGSLKYIYFCCFSLRFKRFQSSLNVICYLMSCCDYMDSLYLNYFLPVSILF